MEKASEIKRRAQRLVLNGDLDGALREYEKLVSSGEVDPYHLVLVGDLLFKKGDQPAAGKRYMEAVSSYEKAGLYKNAIAVCKKMGRLSISGIPVLERLAALHALDGLTAEASLYYLQLADSQIQQDALDAAILSLRKAFDLSPENAKPLERLAELHITIGDNDKAGETLLEAAGHYDRLGQISEATRCRTRAAELGTRRSHKPTLPAPTPQAPTPAPRAPSPPASGPAKMPTAPRGETPTHLKLPSTIPTISGLPTRETKPPPAPAPTPVAKSPPAEMPRAGDDRSSPKERSGLGIERVGAGEMDLPGLRFVSPVESAPAGATGGDAPNEPPAIKTRRPAEPAEESGPPYSAATRSERGTHPSAAPVGDPQGMEEVSRNLSRAQELLRAGDRAAAVSALAVAAQSYDRMGRLESAAAIYRSLSQTMEPPLQVMLLWLKNCQLRNDASEAGHVACELGDRALNEGDAAGAREWFERARALDERNETAARRLLHLATNSADNPGGAVSEWIRPDSPASPGRLPMETRMGGVVDGPLLGTHETQPGVEMPFETTHAEADRAAPMVSAGYEVPHGGATAEAPPASRAKADAPVTAKPETPKPKARGEVVVNKETESVFALSEEPENIRMEVNYDTEGQSSPDLRDLVAEFQRGVEEHLASDPQVLYDFGVSYREMGLLDDAIEAFRGAARSPRHTLSATEMLVRCLIDQGKAEDAVQELRETLRHPRLDGSGALRLRYDLGGALELTGRRSEALTVFQQLEATQAGLWDVAQRVAILRKALGHP